MRKKRAFLEADAEPCRTAYMLGTWSRAHIMDAASAATMTAAAQPPRRRPLPEWQRPPSPRPDQDARQHLSLDSLVKGKIPHGRAT